MYWTNRYTVPSGSFGWPLGSQTNTSSTLGNQILGTLRGTIGEDDPTFMVEVLELCLHKIVEHSGILADACIREDAPCISTSAHALKSSMAMIGCADFSSICALLERESRTHTDFHILRRHVQCVQQAFPFIEETIRGLIKQLRYQTN